MIFEIHVYLVGKHKEQWLFDALQEYEKRLQNTACIHWCFYKTDRELEKALQSISHFIALDPKGKTFTSEDFSVFLHHELTHQGKNLYFVIGGSLGLTPLMRQRADRLISLSPLTFTHQMTRLILIEQIYRAFAIGQNSPYHK